MTYFHSVRFDTFIFKDSNNASIRVQNFKNFLPLKRKHFIFIKAFQAWETVQRRRYEFCAKINGDKKRK